MRFEPNAVTFDPVAFDTLLATQGVQLVHWRAMRCPVGMIDRYDSRRPHSDHSGCSNGFIYTKVGTITSAFTNSGVEAKQNDAGIGDGSTVQITSPRQYDDTDEEVQIAPFDRFYLNEENITVPHWQLMEASVTGRDRLSFPAVKVFDIVDATGKRYTTGDYEIQDGQIVWTNGGPGYDAESQRGVIYAIRYSYRPYYYVERVNHQVRVAQVATAEGRKVIRMPQNYTLVRENVFEKEEQDPESVTPDSPRQAPAPRQGPFSPR